jgi:hypothetical protein
MTKQNENKVKLTRFSSKQAKARRDELKAIAAKCVTYKELSNDKASGKRFNKGTSGTTEPSKKSKIEISRSADIGESSTSSVEVEDEFEQENERERSKHYDDQQNLFNDWDREKNNLMNRYFMSFSNGKIPHASTTEVSVLASCTKCAYEHESTVQVYFLNSKNNTITKLTHSNYCILIETLY